jgi:hypothetical protein
MFFDIKRHNLEKNHAFSEITNIGMMINSWHWGYFQAKVITTLVSILANLTLIILFSELLRFFKKLFLPNQKYIYCER